MSSSISHKQAIMFSKGHEQLLGVFHLLIHPRVGCTKRAHKYICWFVRPGARKELPGNSQSGRCGGAHSVVDGTQRKWRCCNLVAFSLRIHRVLGKATWRGLKGKE